MSDHSQVIVDLDVGPGEAAALADAVRVWLADEGIIEREPSDSVLGAGLGYRPGPNYRVAVKMIDDALLRSRPNGLEIVVGRTVFDAGGNGVELRCDACGHVFEPDHSWYDAAGAWFYGDDAVRFSCPKCGMLRRLTEWHGPWPSATLASNSGDGRPCARTSLTP